MVQHEGENESNPRAITSLNFATSLLVIVETVFYQMVMCSIDNATVLRLVKQWNKFLAPVFALIQLSGGLVIVYLSYQIIFGILI